MQLKAARRATAGFTLVELMVVIALVAIGLRLAVPAFNGMLTNAKVRTVAEALQNGLRTAQSEAMRRNRMVVFSLTDGAPALETGATANGRNWQIHTVARAEGDGNTKAFVVGGALGDTSRAVATNGPTAVCFSSSGRMAVPDTSSGVSGATCALEAGSFDVTSLNGNLRLRIQVALNGRVRMCDPLKTYSTATPDGC